MAKPKQQTPIRLVVDSLERTEALLKQLQAAYPDLRKVPVHRRDAIKTARVSLEKAASALRLVIEEDARPDDDPGK